MAGGPKKDEGVRCSRRRDRARVEIRATHPSKGAKGGGLGGLPVGAGAVPVESRLGDMPIEANREAISSDHMPAGIDAPAGGNRDRRAVMGGETDHELTTARRATVRVEKVVDGRDGVLARRLEGQAAPGHDHVSDRDFRFPHWPGR